jgi:cytochrome c peroxidase
LFFDTRLSRDNSLSCASCHHQSQAFAESLPVSLGIEGRQGFRNAPSLANLAWHERFMWDGGVPSLELQVMAPIHDPNEFDFNILKASEALVRDEALNNLSQRAYGRDIDAYVIIRAIASFERTFVSANSPYDQYLNGDISALPSAAIRGMSLFFGPEANCASCHGGFNLRNEGYANVGLYEVYEDSGRERITMNPEDNGKFKIPSLRNVALTAPYMHDGSIADLEGVVRFFASGGAKHANKDKRMQALDLSEQDISDLVIFLTYLSDEEFIQNAQFTP